MKKSSIVDPVSKEAPGSLEIRFSVPRNYNASDLLYANLEAGRGDKVAIYSAAGSATYYELCSKASRVGNALKSLGLSQGDRVLLFLDDTQNYPAAFFGAIRAGFVPMLINTLSPKDLLRFYIKDSGAKVVIVEGGFSHLFDQDTIEGTDLEAQITIGECKANTKRLKHFDWNELIAQFDETMKVAPTQRDDMAFWMYSSGSTGLPKGIVHLQHDMLYTAQSFARHVLKIAPDDICFSVPKIFFAYGLGNSLVFPFSVGASAVLNAGRPTPDVVFDLVEHFRPTLFFGLPTLYNSLMQSDAVAGADFSSVRVCLSAAEVLSAELSASWKQRFGHEIVEGLGSTELTHIYLSNLPGNTRPGSAGKRVPGYETRLTDMDGNTVAQGEEGVMWVRGDSSAPCYWNRDDKTEETMRDDWIWTGDRFEEDEDGFYFFRGRADDLIKVSGQWVYPLEIELCLSDHEKVKECAVMGIERADRRMMLKAFVVTAPGINADEDLTIELQSFVKKNLLPYKYPKEISYVSELPKTGTGKIDRLALSQTQE